MDLISHLVNVVLREVLLNEDYMKGYIWFSVLTAFEKPVLAKVATGRAYLKFRPT